MAFINFVRIAGNLLFNILFQDYFSDTLTMKA